MQRDALFRALLTTAGDGIVVINERGMVQAYNTACEMLFGYSADEVIGRNVKMLMPEPFRDEHDWYLENYRETGGKRVVGSGREVEGCRRDGTTFPMYLSVGEGAFNGDRIFVAIIRDLTERQATERRLQELQTELLHVSRLSDMGQMSSALAHELNQPLAAITNYVNAARRTLDNDGPESLSRAKDLMDKATAQTLRAGTIIRNLRAFVAKRDGQRTREGINRVVDEAIALSFTGTADLHVKVTRRLAPKLQPVLIDKVQIQQVLINLIRNSIEAMATVEDRELTAVTEADEEHGVTVTIADTGPGLSPDVLPRLFQPFVTTKESGMGLGLTICQSIVESHGGRIWVLNPDTPGAGFAFHLPFASTGEK